MENLGIRPPWLPSSKAPHDRDDKEREMQAEVAAGLSTLANHGVSGGGTLRNRSVSRRRYTSHRSESAHRAGNDGDDVMKVIDSSRGTPRPVHRLLVVSTACFLFLCSVLVLSTSLGSMVAMFDFHQCPSVTHVNHCWLDEEHPAKMPSVHLSLTSIIFIFDSVWALGL